MSALRLAELSEEQSVRQDALLAPIGGLAISSMHLSPNPEPLPAQTEAYPTTITAVSIDRTPPAATHWHSMNAVLGPTSAANYDRVYTAMKTPIERHIFGMVGNRDAVEDLAADVFEKGWRAINRMPNRVITQPSSWFYRIATNTALDWLHHRKYERAAFYQPLYKPGDALDALANTIASPHDGQWYEKRISDREMLAYVFKRLPPTYAEALYLSGNYGLDYPTIAKQLGISHSAVKMRMVRAQARARTLAAEYTSGQLATKRAVTARIVD